jgi:predicted  nucleic acid-binding Zn-ribbon protein
MNRKRLDTILAVIMVITVLLTAPPFYMQVEASSESWLEKIISDTPSAVTSVFVGDADNDGENEVVVGTWSATNEVRLYEKNGVAWNEEIIVSAPVSIYSLAIGDADNDGTNEVVIGMVSTTNELRAYEYKLGSWIEDIISDLPNTVYSIAIGDADSDGKNEVVCGLQSSSNEVRSYKKHTTGWVEDIIVDAPTNVRSVGIGDADRDGKNEIVIGMDSTTNEVRAYENSSGIWIEDIITDTPNNVYDIAVGDADNDGGNEVVIGLHSSSNEVRAYKKSGGIWVEDIISDTPTDVWTCAIGDADYDGQNEVVIGMMSTSGELRAYEKQEGVWTEDIIGNTPTDIFSVAIDDADNDGETDVVIGMWSTSNEVRFYSYDLGDLVFISHDNGDYVKGEICLEVAVSSGAIIEVQFYLNNELVHIDAQSPYQYIVDTKSLTEDGLYTVKAVGVVSNTPPIEDIIEIIVNNIVEIGNFITLNTLKSVYEPDQDISAVVTTSSPPTFDSLGLMLNYFDPGGNCLFAINNTFPAANQYIVGIPIYSDALPGIYSINASAYGYDKGTMIWQASSQTTFEVSGYGLHQHMGQLNSSLMGMEITLGDIQSRVIEIQTDLDGMSLLDIRNNLDYLNQTLNSKIDGLNADLFDVNESLQNKISDAESNILENAIGSNETLRPWLDDALAKIESDIAWANSTIHTQLSDMQLATAFFYTSISENLSELFNALAQQEANLLAQHNAINYAIYTFNETISNAPELSTSDILEGINESISKIQNLQGNITVHDSEIRALMDSLADLVETETNYTKSELLDNISIVFNQLQIMDSEIIDHDSEVKEDITNLSGLVTDLNTMDFSDIDNKLSELAHSVSEHDLQIGHEIMVLEQWIAGFNEEIEEKLTVINESLEDLEKLDDIISDINEFDQSFQSSDGKAQNTGEDQGMGLTLAIIMLMVLSIVLVLGMILLFRENKVLKSTLGLNHNQKNIEIKSKMHHKKII